MQASAAKSHILTNLCKSDPDYPNQYELKLSNEPINSIIERTEITNTRSTLVYDIKYKKNNNTCHETTKE